MTCIELTDIGFSYIAGRKGIFSNLSLKFNPSEQVAIIGRNGSGKTTLAKLIIGMLKPSTGHINFDGKLIEKKSIAEIAEKVGYVFQNPNIMLFTNSVENELLLSLQRFNFTKNVKEEKINSMLDFFDIAKYRKIHPRLLSRGEKQKLALATVLIQDPDAIILDEPFSGIDMAQKIIIREFIGKLKDQKKLVIIITHDLDSVLEESNRVIALSSGKIVFDGKKTDFFKDSKNLHKAGLTETYMLKMLYSLQQDGLPETILQRKEVIGFFSKRINDT